MARKSKSLIVDKFAASPVGDKAEFAYLWDCARQAFPTMVNDETHFGYIGTDFTVHYFQLWGDPTRYTVPVSERFAKIHADAR